MGNSNGFVPFLFAGHTLIPAKMWKRDKNAGMTPNKLGKAHDTVP